MSKGQVEISARVLRQEDSGGPGGKAGDAKSEKGKRYLPICEDIFCLDLRVGRIVDVERPPNTDALYMLNADLGDGKTLRTVSKLVKHISADAMKGRLAVIICNLKPSRIKGVCSEGMILCIAGPDEKHIEIVDPPINSVIGDRVIVKEYTGTPYNQLNAKKSSWARLQSQVRCNNNKVVTFKGFPLIVQGKGPLMAPTLTNGQMW